MTGSECSCNLSGASSVAWQELMALLHAEDGNWDIILRRIEHTRNTSTSALGRSSTVPSAQMISVLVFAVLCPASKTSHKTIAQGRVQFARLYMDSTSIDIIISINMCGGVLTLMSTPPTNATKYGEPSKRELHNPPREIPFY